jgi:DNA helicase-2/ATP-dependent DNA helicase PcrA
VLFVAGDDDQSVYSFRFAAPSGIQNIPNLYPNAELHQLDECFRCMPEVLACAVRLITSFPPQNRIPKSSASLYRHCNPAANGIVHRWRFPTGVSEARAIADSCQTLIQAGMNPRDILILLCNKNALERILVEELTTRSIPFDAPSGESFISGFAGRLGLALTRVVCAPNDYIALRTILGIRNGVGAQTCANICDSIIRNNLNFRDVFYQPLPNGAFSTRETTALNHARALCAQIATWQADDTLQVRGGDIFNIINAMLGTQEANAWHTAVQRLPPSMTLRELRDYLWSDNDEQQAQILGIVYTRQGLDIPQTDILPQRVRIMTMHGSKGLSARVVFIPGLEESLIPSGWRSPYAGLVLEAARLLYVSITRARVSCITSFAERRMIHGRTQPQTPSRYNASLNGPFSARSQGLTAAESQSVMAECAQL